MVPHIEDDDGQHFCKFFCSDFFSCTDQDLNQRVDFNEQIL